MTENVRKVFDMLGLEPNEEFMIDDNEEFMIDDNEKIIYKIDEELQVLCCPDYNKRDWYVFDCSLIIYLIKNPERIIKIPKKKHVGDLSCKNFKGCKGCPLISLECFYDGNTFYKKLNSWFKEFKDKEIYDILKARLDEEVEYNVD